VNQNGYGIICLNNMEIDYFNIKQYAYWNADNKHHRYYDMAMLYYSVLNSPKFIAKRWLFK